MITSAYIIPNIYVFIRIWQQFINKGYRIHFLVIYLILFSVYPLSNLISGDNEGLFANLIGTVADYLLPFYLYLFLFILAFDIFLLLNLFIKVLSRERRKSNLFKFWCLNLILFSSLTVVIAGVINFNTQRISEYNISIPARSSKIRNLRIAFAADFHLKESTPEKFVEKFVKKIKEINPDLMIFGGDILEGDRGDENMLVFEKLLSDIRPKYGVYGVLGNHEYYGGEDKGSFFDKAGIKILNDSVIMIDKSIYLAGRYDSHFRSRKSAEQLLGNIPDSLPLVLVDHRPTETGIVSRTKTDIQLSGHTHNGQMFPINIITRNVYELSWGYRKIGNTHFFVTSGIRLWGPPVRTTGKSEIMVINISFTD
jgi:uncharacterized protein